MVAMMAQIAKARDQYSQPNPTLRPVCIILDLLNPSACVAFLWAHAMWMVHAPNKHRTALQERYG
jgi:hypothetical protein